MQSRSLFALLGALSLAWGCHSHAATSDEPVEVGDSPMLVESHWRIDGGTIGIRFNEDLLALFGIGVEFFGAPPDSRDPRFLQLPIEPDRGLRFNAPHGSFEYFVGGALRLGDGFSLRLGDGSAIDFRIGLLEADLVHPLRLHLRAADGEAWLYVNHLMFEFQEEFRRFEVATADVRAGQALAERLNAPDLAGAPIGELTLSTRVLAWDHPPVLAAALTSEPNFHGYPHPSGGTYQTDVLLTAFDMQFLRCRQSNQVNGCLGGLIDDGEVVFAPNATLRNTNLDTTADVPWYPKFSTSPWPYPYPGNDQHPYLIWNLYRISDGQLEQVGASGVKHAFLTVNTGCPQQPGNILWRNCADTYSTSNNDGSSNLGPRSEIIPAQGRFGRCGSTFDPGCIGSQTGGATSLYDQRLVVRESQLAVDGAEFHADAWYVIQDDMDIFNTMGHRRVALAHLPDPPSGSPRWTIANVGAFVQGPLINAWVDPVQHPTRNVLHADTHGHLRVAVKVKTLGGCPIDSGLSGPCYRYDYAVHNFDWTRAMTQGEPPNLRVTENMGFDRFVVPRVGEQDVWLQPGAHFADHDTEPGNDWVASVSPSAVTWTAPAGQHLFWGSLYRFSFVTNAPPVASLVGPVQLRAAPVGPLGGNHFVTMTMMVPGPRPDWWIFLDGFESPLP
jgi:hypothetical protein